MPAQSGCDQIIIPNLIKINSSNATSYTKDDLFCTLHLGDTDFTANASLGNLVRGVQTYVFSNDNTYTGAPLENRVVPTIDLISGSLEEAIYNCIWVNPTTLGNK